MTATDIFDAWTTYEKVVRGDYMHHRMFFDALANEAGRCLEEPLTILDLGCGDARPILPLFERFDIERYVGIDESDTALRTASHALGAANVAYELRNGSIPDVLEDVHDEFDLVVCSYALHHLATGAKGTVILECRRLLRRGGMLAIIDIFLEPGETRDAYRTRWEANARTTFSGLSAGELDELIDHVRGSDIPESVVDYAVMANLAGFDECRVRLEDAERLNKLVIFQGTSARSARTMTRSRP